MPRRPRSLRFGLVLLSAAGTAAASPQIPLCAGLTVVTAVSQPTGDYESIKTVQTMGARELRLKYTSEAPSTDTLSSNYGQIVNTTIFRKLLRDDLASATLYQQIFAPNSDELIPGTTSLGTSSEVLRGLQSKGESALSISNAPTGQPLRASRETRPHAYDFFTPGKIKRVAVERIPLLVNNRTVELEAIRARGEFAGEAAEFVFLNDEANPLTLRMRLGIDALKAMAPELKETCASLRKAHGANLAPMFANDCREKAGDRDTLQVVKIAYHCDGSPPPRAAAGEGPALPGAPPAADGSAPAGEGVGDLEQALQKSGKADIYSIFFTFNSDAIREESEPTLKEIGALMRKHSSWRLNISGHTDNIASDTYNLDLSRRRAAAVVKALTTRHGVEASRLAYSGQGESAPRDTNETLEGRAKNRRVELIRLP
jgi:outer membrane protein OmpA-like peptidoglycan-associated protein